MKVPHLTRLFYFLSLTIAIWQYCGKTFAESQIDFTEDIELDFGMIAEAEHQENLPMADVEAISIEFKDEEVRALIRKIAEYYDLNVVIPQNLNGRTSIKLRNVTWRQIFEVVLEPLGYTYIEDRNIIKIDSIDELNRRADTRLFPINYAVANQLEVFLSPLIDAAKGGRIQSDERTNTLIITERPTQLNQIAEIIERLDREDEQLIIEAKVFEIMERENEGMGMDWAALSNSLGKQAESLMESILRKDKAVIDPQAFEVILNSLLQQNNVRLISNPSVVVLDGEGAHIKLGERIPAHGHNDPDEQSMQEAQVLGLQDVEVELNVRPEVNNAGFIRLSIGYAAGNQGQPEHGHSSITTRAIASEVLIKDGYTLAIGGMREVSNHSQVVPSLADIPHLDPLFKDRVDVIANRHLVMFVTAKILNPDGTTYQDTLDPRILHEMDITDSEIPGYSIPEKHLETLNKIHRLRSEAALINAELNYQSALLENLNKKKDSSNESN